jgi:hypothetical protein
VSPLWPEVLSIGLFPGACWLRRARGTETPIQCEPGADPHAMLLALASFLDADKAIRKGSRVDVTVSNCMAAITALPWQGNLHRPAELQSYAQVVFETLGMTIDDSWAMHVEFQRHGATGLAYALPKAWMTALIELLEKRGLRLRTILPVSAAAYCRHKTSRSIGNTLLLLQDAAQSSAMVFDGAGMVGYDVEPVIGSAAESSIRLLKRMSARYERIAQIFHWSPVAPDAAPSMHFVADCFPDAKVSLLARSAWGG